MAGSSRSWASEITHYWFHSLTPRQWFMGGEVVNEECRRRFERYLLMLSTRPACEFLSDPKTALGAVLLFDQMPRNLYGGTALAFAFDPLAREISKGALARGWDFGLTGSQKQFLAMPLMHSEDICDQHAALRYYAKLPRRNGWGFAVSHSKMIKRFGRYPHRNDALGRTSTAAEVRAVEAGNKW